VSRSASDVAFWSITGIRHDAEGAAVRSRRKRDGIDTLVRSLIDNGIAEFERSSGARQHSRLMRSRKPPRRLAALDTPARTTSSGAPTIWYGLAAGSDPGIPHVPDRRSRAREPESEITPALRAKILGLNGAKVYSRARKK
jgi:hypothetical protein